MVLAVAVVPAVLVTKVLLMVAEMVVQVLYFLQLLEILRIL